MRAALYARVSTEEQTEGYSIDAQRRSFRALCEGRGWIVGHEYIEAGKSAHTDDIRKRPVFKQAMEDALAGKYDVLVVHKIDRFSRKLRITLEYFEKLGKAGVGFVSIENQIDYSTPTGKFMLVMQGGLAELYSDNLSQETKKGWAERKAQGLYCGLLPFGVMKGKDGIPVPDRKQVDNGAGPVSNIDGLLLAFEETVNKSDRELARLLNNRGYRTIYGRLFSKDTVRGIVQNRFYIGELPDGKGGWIKGKHEPLVPLELFEESQTARARRNTFRGTIRADAKVRSLSGIARCGECGANLRVFRSNGRTRLVCNARVQNADCSQKSSYLDFYDEQLKEYLNAFHIPEDYKNRILESHRKLQSAYDDVDKRRSALEKRLQRVKELYEWGHKSKEEYWADYSEIRKELDSLSPKNSDNAELERLATFLNDISLAWQQADEHQRNILAKQLFEVIWIKNQKVLAVTPRPEFKPFFDLQYEGLSNGILQWRPRWGSRSYLQYLGEGLFPVVSEIAVNNKFKIPQNLWPEISEQRNSRILRQLAKQYGVSHETVRRDMRRLPKADYNRTQ